MGTLILFFNIKETFFVDIESKRLCLVSSAITLPSFNIVIEQFINDICAAKLPMRLHWHRSMQSQSAIIYFIKKYKKYLGFNGVAPNTRLLVSQDDFIIAVNKPHGLLVHRTKIAEEQEHFASLFERQTSFLCRPKMEAGLQAPLRGILELFLNFFFTPKISNFL